MALAGHATRLKVSGAAVPVTGEACTSLGGGVYQVTNTARRIIDRSAAVVVKDTGTPVSATLWSFDYLFGKVTFSGYSPTGAVTVDASYLPVATIAEVKSFSLQAGGDLADRTTFDSAGVKQRQATLRDASGSFVMLSSPLDDIDPVTGGTQSLHAVLTGGTPKLLETLFGTQYLRQWVLLEGIEIGASVDGLVESSVSYQTAPAGSGAALAFGT